MRVTNRMMNNNSLTNINRNKEYLDKLNNQLASEKKITRPSDDPVVAIRALKLRGNVTELTQYYDKNTKDAEAWLTATQDAVESTKGILISMKAQFTTGATGTNTVESRNAILSELKALKDQIYDDGNADYAGRQLFTGYRTSTKLTLEEEDVPTIYEGITETFSRADADKITLINGKLAANTDIVDAPVTPVKEQVVTSSEFTRIRLAYNNVDPGSANAINLTDKDGNALSPSSISLSTLNKDSYATYDEYIDAITATLKGGKSVLIPETGEVLLDSDSAATVMALKDSDVMTVIYDKSNWEEGDIRPEHYFDCEQKILDDDGNVIDQITYDTHDQAINYDVSSNQQLKINTNASEVFVHGIGRDIEGIISAIEDSNIAESNVKKLESMMEEYEEGSAEYENIRLTLDAANKQKALVDDRLQKLFEHGLTTFSGYIDKATLAGTAIGSTIERLDLVRNRLMDLKTTARELADDNENVDIIDITIDVKEAEMTYNAALMATGQISQQSLLNYI